MIVKDEVLMAEFRAPGRCELCWRWFYRRDPNHLTCRGMGGGFRLDIRINLIACCRSCHNEFHRGKDAADVAFAVVARREGLTVEELRQQLADLRRA